MGRNSGERGKSPQSQERDDRILALARSQYGHVTRKQLLGLGLGRGAIETRLDSHSFVAIHRGVYRVGPRRDEPTARAAAAVLACGDGAILSHSSAATLWGMSARWEFPFEVTVTAGDPRPPGITTHRCRTLQRQDVRVQLGIKATSPARTVLDGAPTRTERQLTRMVNDARRNGLLHLHTLTELLDRCPNHPGTKLLRPFTEQTPGVTRSDFEDDFLAFVARYGFPTPQINTRALGREVDVLFEAHKLIVELDGWEFHNDRRSFIDDREEDSEALRHGYTTMRITHERLRDAPDAEAARLDEILRRRRPQGS
jgi:hypothetical protein